MFNFAIANCGWYAVILDLLNTEEQTISSETGYKLTTTICNSSQRYTEPRNAAAEKC